MSLPKGSLHLANGLSYEGRSFGAPISRGGECVFQTGMVGYIESLTDPSYTGQILVLSYPHIGNYGVPPVETDEFGVLKNFESSRIHVAGLIVADYSDSFSHWNAIKSLGAWLKENNVPAICHVDTRAIIKQIRDNGSLLGSVLHEDTPASEVVPEDPNKRNLVAEVSCAEPRFYGPEDADVTVLAVDCGMKLNQLRSLLKRGCRVHVVPWDYDFTELEFDGLFLSNGPGNPVKAAETVKNIRTFIGSEAKKQGSQIRPIMGVCLGNQLLALAVGATTYKLPFGNRYVSRVHATVS